MGEGFVELAKFAGGFGEGELGVGVFGGDGDGVGGAGVGAAVILIVHVEAGDLEVFGDALVGGLAGDGWEAVVSFFAGGGGFGGFVVVGWVGEGADGAALGV